jgi:hypothetical protein
MDAAAVSPQIRNSEMACEKTGKKAATAAAKTLRSKSASKNAKTAAGSALAQRPDRKKGRR